MVCRFFNWEVIFFNWFNIWSKIFNEVFLVKIEWLYMDRREYLKIVFICYCSINILGDIKWDGIDTGYKFIFFLFSVMKMVIKDMLRFL